MTRLLTHWPCQVVVPDRPGWARNPPDLAGRHSSLLSSPSSPQLASRRTSRRWRSHETHLILKRRCFYMVIPWRYLPCEGCSIFTIGIPGFTGIVFCLQNSWRRPCITATQIKQSARRLSIIWKMGILNLHFFVHLVRE